MYAIIRLKSAARRGAGNTADAPYPTQGVRPMSSFPDSTPSDDTITIPLTRGYATVVDAVDSDLAKLRWHTWANAGVRNVYAKRGFRQDGISQTEMLHRVILSRVLGRPLLSGEQADHINGNGLDNRRSNIRLATSEQNGCNRRKSVNNTSGYKGVTWDKHNGKWKASIQVGKRPRFIGHFNTPEEAHAAYCEAAERLHGEFARFE